MKKPFDLQKFAEAEGEPPVATGEIPSTSPEAAAADSQPQQTAEAAPQEESHSLFSEDFDAKSAFFRAGSVAQEEGAPEPNPDTPRSQPTSSDTASATATPTSGGQAGEAGTPFRVLKAGGVEIPVHSAEEYDRMALSGLQAEALRQRLAPLAPVIGAIEQDPDMARAVAEFITARRKQVADPQSPPSTPATPPKQAEDETFEAYETRLNAWKEERQKTLVDQRVKELLIEQDRNTREAHAREIQSRVAIKVRADPHMEDVLGAIRSPAFPASLRETMANDPQAFVTVYDTISRIQGREPFFAKQPPQAQAQPVLQAQPESRVQLKGKGAPFTEGGGVASSQPGTQLPDFRVMAEAEFEKFLAKSKSQGF